MLAYMIRRMLFSIIFLFAVATLVFFLVHALPGDPVSVLLGQSGAEGGEKMVAALRTRLGLDKPLISQYLTWMKGDFGRSLLTSFPVTSLIGKRLPRSMELILLALFVSVMVAIPLGIAAALHSGTWVDAMLNVFATVGIAVPIYVIGLIAIVVFAVRLSWLPAGNYVSLFEKGPAEHVRYLILPVVTLAVTRCAIILRMTRSSVMDTLREDYVRTARAKGLRESSVRYKHVLRNSLIPVVTLLGLQIGRSIGSTVLVEAIFNWPGLSTLLISSATGRDYPVLQGILLTIAVLIISINFIVDMTYVFLDPRVKYG